MRSNRRAVWLYPLFQIPLILFGTFLVTAFLFWLLGLGRPQVAVAIALDLSNSTYSSSSFNAPGSIMAQEVKAVKSYLEKNSPKLLNRPNQVQIFGFGGVVKPLTNTFEADSKKTESQLTQALQDPALPNQIIPATTNLDRAITEGTDALNGIPDRCRELLLVTDGEAAVSPSVIAEAVARKVKINSVVVGSEAPALKGAALVTGGVYKTGNSGNLESFFTDSFFEGFNSNLRWVIFWLGLAWIAFMWMLTLPLDEWFFQGLLKQHWSIAGKLALGNSLFWTASTLGIIWRLAGGIPFISKC
jgi:Ca-activated chloride channel homolog